MNDTAIEGRRRVLCVDGDAETRALLADVLSAYDVVFAHNAFAALSCMKRTAFHGYVLECWLPDWSGLSLCRQIRNSDPYGPVLFYSGAVRENDQARALRAGANAYLCKPTAPDVLCSKLRAFVGLAEAESLQAKADAQRAIRDELARLKAVQARLAYPDSLLFSSLERTAKPRAFRAFTDARGTRGFFEDWWPSLIQEVMHEALPKLADDEVQDVWKRV